VRRRVCSAMPSRLVLHVLNAMLLMSFAAQADTLRVELDGSGDFADIQPAVESAAPGDTIRIGPGRFQTFHPCVAPAWTEETVVWVTKDDLTFIGAGTGVTIVGPTSFSGVAGSDPKAFCATDVKSGAIRDLTIENIETGVYWAGGRVAIDNCDFRGDHSWFGAVALWTGGSVVANCRFELGDGAFGCYVGSGATDNFIEDCVFMGAAHAVIAGNGSTGTIVRNCEINSPRVGFNLGLGGSGTFSNCVIRGATECAIWVFDDYRANLEDIHIDGGKAGITAGSGGQITGTGVVIEGTVNEPLTFFSARPSSLNRSHLLPAPGIRAVVCYSANIQTVHDLSGNWWGTTDLQAINDLILDGNDDPAIKAYVRISPIAEGLVPVESTSWGDLKAAFR